MSGKKGTKKDGQKDAEADKEQTINAVGDPELKPAAKAKKRPVEESGELSAMVGAVEAQENPAKKERKVKKRSLEDSDENAAGDVVKKPKRSTKTALADTIDETSMVEANGEAQANGVVSSLHTFGLSEQTLQALSARGIDNLFPIQELTYPHLRAGKDLIGRARTGQGKTLAFCLPTIERLLEANSRVDSRKPFVVCLTPTRELAKQIVGEVESVVSNLSVCAVYGGTNINEQRTQLRKGVHIIVGTPGRVLDLLERDALDLSRVMIRVLDEADQMLDMGFQDDVDKIFEAMKSAGGTCQTILFSATLPPWVKKVTQKYMKSNKLTVDLVENEDEKASVTVKHIAIPCHWTSLASTISDVVSLYAGSQQRTIVFCETKRECNELCLGGGIQFDCQALHGDIPQAQRENTLAAFKEGRFQVLLATDVAARGLDMTVDLVVNAKPPVRMSGKPDTETYVHRSGRTGRAGRKGICVTLYTPKLRPAVKEIEQTVGNTFEWRGAPQPSEITNASAALAFDEIKAVLKDAVMPFEAQASQLVEELGAERAVAAALAVITGHTKPLRQRSLLSNSDGYITVQFHSRQAIFSPTFVFNELRTAFALDETVIESVRSMTITADNKGAVFDVSGEFKAQVQALMDRPAVSGSTLSFPTTIPPLKDHFSAATRSSPRGRGGRGDRGTRGRRGRGRRPSHYA